MALLRFFRYSRDTTSLPAKRHSNANLAYYDFLLRACFKGGVLEQQ